MAVGLTRLGLRATWASVLGDDAHGDYLADAVAELGITPLVRRAAGPTALMFKAGGARRRPRGAAGPLTTPRSPSTPDALLTDDVLEPATASTTCT